IETDTTQEKEIGGVGQVEGEDSIDQVLRRERRGIHGDLVGGHPAEHALGPKGEVAMGVFVDIRAVRHRLPLIVIVLGKGLVLERGLAEKETNEQEHSYGDSVGKDRFVPGLFHIRTILNKNNSNMVSFWRISRGRFEHLILLNRYGLKINQSSLPSFALARFPLDPTRERHATADSVFSIQDRCLSERLLLVFPQGTQLAPLQGRSLRQDDRHAGIRY